MLGDQEVPALALSRQDPAAPPTGGPSKDGGTADRGMRPSALIVGDAFCREKRDPRTWAYLEPRETHLGPGGGAEGPLPADRSPPLGCLLCGGMGPTGPQLKVTYLPPPSSPRGAPVTTLLSRAGAVSAGLHWGAAGVLRFWERKCEATLQRVPALCSSPSGMSCPCFFTPG